MAEERKKTLRRVIWMAAGAAMLFLAALGVVYSKELFAALSLVWTAVLPLLLGCVIAYLVNLIMGRIERVYFPGAKGGILAASRRPVCLVLSFAVIAAVIAAIVNLVLPEVKASWGVLRDGVMTVAQSAYSWGEANVDALTNALGAGGLDELRQGFVAFFESVSNGDASRFTEVIGSLFSTASSIAHGAFIALVALVFSLYLLIDKERVINGGAAAVDLLLPPRAAAAVHHATDVANRAFSRFITGQCIEAVILGTLCALGMTLFGMPYAAAIGACVGLTALVPVFGAWLGGAVGFLMILTVDPMTAVWFVVFLVILQQFETHLIYPNVVGASVGLPGIWVFAGVLVGGALFGVLGMFLGVPTIATVRTLAMEYAAGVRARRAEAIEKRPVRADAEANDAAHDGQAAHDGEKTADAPAAREDSIAGKAHGASAPSASSGDSEMGD